jgi:CheY-like chemotaxis protein
MKEEEKQSQIIKLALVVEDNPICCTILSRQLEYLNYTIDIATDAKTAIQKLSEQTYALILSDLRLPDKPGMEVIKAAREYETNQGTPFIVVSAQISKKDFPTYLSLGADAVLIKPYSLEVLESTIQRCYQKPYYRRKFFYQLDACIKDFKDNLPPPKTEDEFQQWLHHFRKLLSRSLLILREYEQWSKFEKLRMIEKK